MKTFSLLLLACISWPLFAATPIGLLEALANGYVTVTAKGEGGYTGKVMALEITSTHKRELTVDIPAGLQMHSEDNTIQDLIITENRQLVLAANSKRKVIVNAMCIQPHASSPYAGSAYLLGTMASDTLLQLAQYLASKKYYDYLGQSAVWAIVNGDGLETVYGNDPLKLKDLTTFMQTLTGLPTPWYHTEKQAPPPGQVFSQEPAILHATFQFDLPRAGTATLAIYNEAGEVVFPIRENMKLVSGKSTMKYKIEVRGYKKGKYYTRLHLDGKLFQENAFEI